MIPWWGWLIIGCVALVVVGWVTMAAIGLAMFRKASRQVDSLLKQRPKPRGDRWT